MKYCMMWQSFGAGPQWQVETSFPSDEMALDYTKRTMENDQGVRSGCMALLCFRLGENEELIGRFVLDKPVARNTK